MAGAPPLRPLAGAGPDRGRIGPQETAVAADELCIETRLRGLTPTAAGFGLEGRMFVTDLVRNLAWSLRSTRRNLPNPDSVLPADALAPVRREPRRPAAQDAADASSRRKPGGAAAPADAGAGAGIDVQV